MSLESKGGAAGRAFVVQFLAAPDGRVAAFRGRAERIGSGESTRFESAAELVDLLERSLGIGARSAERPEHRQDSRGAKRP